ncbi:MAG: hypothetical protein FJX25_03980 [Alphaproteobacteria bacterium]|nr:hypothetical protein [Alphaproteobacteria bacterium]
MVELLFILLVTGAKLAASSAVGEFANGGGKEAFEALKDRLAGAHDVKSLPLLEEADQNPAFEEAVKAELAKPEIAQDAELLELAERLREAIEALPAETKTRCAVNIETIRAGGNLYIETFEGVKAKIATSEGDITFRDLRDAPDRAVRIIGPRIFPILIILGLASGIVYALLL